MKTSEKINEIASALSKAQGAMKTAVFDSKNPHFKSRYASLTAIMEVARGPLLENGLSIVHTISKDNEELVLTTTLLHISGQFISGELPLVLSKKDMQGIGSAVTYAKRYCTAAILGIVSDEDDDGNGACGLDGNNSSKKNSNPMPPKPQIKHKTFSEINNIKENIFKEYTKIKSINDDRIDAFNEVFKEEMEEVKRFASTRIIKDKTFDILSFFNKYITELSAIKERDDFMLRLDEIVNIERPHE